MDVDRSGEEEAAHYEAAEEAFLTAIRDERHRATLTDLADAVAVKATAWNRAEYAALHAATTDVERAGRDHSTERTELLTHLWSDIARAFHGEPSHRDG